MRCRRNYVTIDQDLTFDSVAKESKRFCRIGIVASSIFQMQPRGFCFELTFHSGDSYMPVSDLAIYSYQPIVGEILIAKISKSDAFPRFISTQSYHDIVEIARANAPKVFLIDCGKPDRGLDLIRNILKVSPETKVVIFTGIESSEHAVISLDSGAAGYISSACSKIDVVTALELVASGQTFVSPHIAALVIKRMRRVSDEDKRGADQRMSYREEQIARLLLKGQTNRAIADRLGLSEKTIKYYMTNLMQKFAARNRLELAMALPKAPQSVHHFQ